jgi:hypothetical protein
MPRSLSHRGKVIDARSGCKPARIVLREYVKYCARKIACCSGRAVLIINYSHDFSGLGQP